MKVRSTSHTMAHHSFPSKMNGLQRILCCPTYLGSFDRVMKRTWGHRFNMFVMRRDILDGYCRWLFDLLPETEKLLDISGYDAYDARVFGFLAERLLDVYFLREKIPFLDCPTVHLESQHWGRKICRFLLRKFTGHSGR